MMRKIKVLVVDDSLLFRELIVKGISTDVGIEVVGAAENPYDARDKIIQYEPDVITLDIEMPRMNGIEFLKKLMPQYPLPVIVVSFESVNISEALKAGAVDFITKPQLNHAKSVEQFILELITKIKIASTTNVSKWKYESTTGTIHKTVYPIKREIKVIAIGASTGGTEAIACILSKLPNDLPGIVIVQHMPPVFTKMYADRLNTICSMEVMEAQNGDLILPGRVLIAPGDFQMQVNGSSDEPFVECFIGEKVSGHCPSVDVLFESVADRIGKKSLGVILTGMGNDGAKGLLSMKRKGAITLGQDEKSSIVYGMPKIAYELGGVQQQISLELMAEMIFSTVKNLF
ncbi:MAG: chemotaxis response regulator protein-glutamate methylesterase [Firmicutes bacterium HGW-Firmicutes-1]|jgi:two-component system chemotaxis response regulator CheB|nr:MAG: chemotaxis response regulator protein-glutamate methylesterase [Firmicutes bacterium HGW-Firmicutes-1]